MERSARTHVLVMSTTEAAIQLQASVRVLLDIPGQIAKPRVR